MHLSIGIAIMKIRVRKAARKQERTGTGLHVLGIKGRMVSKTTMGEDNGELNRDVLCHLRQ